MSTEGSEVVRLEQRTPFTMVDSPIIRAIDDYVALGLYVDMLSLAARLADQPPRAVPDPPAGADRSHHGHERADGAGTRVPGPISTGRRTMDDAYLRCARHRSPLSELPRPPPTVSRPVPDRDQYGTERPSQPEPVHGSRPLRTLPARPPSRTEYQISGTRRTGLQPSGNRIPAIPLADPRPADDRPTGRLAGLWRASRRSP